VFDVPSRREFIKVGVTAAVGVAVGAAAGDSYGASKFASERQGLQGQIDDLNRRLGRAQLTGTVKVYNWSEYIAEGLLTTFEEEYGVKVVYDTFESMDEARAKISTGNSGYDVVILTDYVVPDAIAGGLLEPLDLDNIPNYKHVDDKFRTLDYDPGNKYTLPYVWGTTGLGVNTKEVTETVDGWAQVFDTDFLKKYSKKVTMLSEARDLIGAAMKYLGYSLNSADDKELQQAKEALLNQKQYLAKYADATDYIPGLASLQFLVSHAYNGDVYVAASENKDVHYVIPKEGTTLWIDNMTIAKGAPNKAAGEAFIDYILRPEVDALITNFRNYASPNKDATQLVLPAIRDDNGIYPSPEVMQKLEAMRPFSADEKAKYDAVYTEIISS
jgi:spermidine/putrescine transport system substrate-binding protein